MAAGAGHAGLADGQNPVIHLRHIEGLAVEDLVLEEDDRVFVADRGLQEALRIRCGIGLDHLEAGDLAVPRRIILAVLGGHARRRPVRATEDDGQPNWPPDM